MSAAKREDLTRRRIDELITRYELNPDLRDIYVEGEWDRRIITWFLRRAGVTNVMAYDIDAIDISDDCLATYDLPEGKKGRVVALAFELQNSITDFRQVTCIADKDYDYLLGRQHTSPLLMMTDFSTQEAYFLNESVFDKFLEIVAGGSPISSISLLKHLLPYLQYFHLIRAANLSLKWGMKWLSPDKCCNIENNVIVVDTDMFLDRYLHKNNRLGQKNEFVLKCELLKRRLTSDPLQHVSKNDIFSLLAEWLPRFCKDKVLHQAEYIARSLAGCAEFEIIAAYPMYKALLAKLAPFDAI